MNFEEHFKNKKTIIDIRGYKALILNKNNPIENNKT